MSINQFISVQSVARVTMAEKIRPTRTRREAKDSFSSFLKQASEALKDAKNADDSDIKNPFLDKLGRA